jgi:hypothetical protein
MSSSYRKRARDVLYAAGTVVAACAVVVPAHAYEFYYQPLVQLSTAYNTNLDLDPGGSRRAEGYFADAATNIGFATPQSETTIQPRLLYNYYPDASDRDRLEGFLNFNGYYTWQRDRFNFAGFFDHRDDVNAEQPQAESNPVNPGIGESPASNGVTSVGTTRNYLIVDPTYTHQLTPLSSMGIAGEYQGIRYSPEDTNGHLDFNFYQARLFYARKLNLRTDFSVGGYYSRYEAGLVDSTSNAEGVQLAGGYDWTEILHSQLSVQYQDTKLESQSQNGVTVRPWGASFSTVYKQEITSYTVSIGRSISPNSAGTLYNTDQIRGQYDRDLSARMHFTGAVRLLQDKAVSAAFGVDERRYANALVRLQYMLTETIFVAGNYSYTYQKYQTDPTEAQGHIIRLTFGYRGLKRQR